MKSSLSTPSLKKAPLATEDHLDDLEGAASEVKDSEVKDSEVKIVHLRPHQRSHNQRRCQSEVTPSKTAELLVRKFCPDIRNYKESLCRDFFCKSVVL